MNAVGKNYKKTPLLTNQTLNTAIIKRLAFHLLKVKMQKKKLFNFLSVNKKWQERHQEKGHQQ